MGWLIAAAVTAAVLLAPLTLSARYHAGKGRVRLWIVLVPLRLLPPKEKPANGEKREKRPKRNSKNPPPAGGEETEKPGGALRQAGQLLALFETLPALVRRLFAGRLTRLRVTALIAGEDAADAALQYGRVCALLYPALGALAASLRLVRPRVTIRCDYARQRSLVEGRVAVYLPLGGALYAALRWLLDFIKIKKEGITA